MGRKLVIVGGGHLGAALAEGLLEAKWCARAELGVVELSAHQRTVLGERLVGVAVLESFTGEPLDLDVVLCVKPDDAPAALRTMASAGVRRVLSVVAGLSTTRIEAAFAGPVAVVRAMPNTPVVVRHGASAMAGGAHVSRNDLDWADAVLRAVGTVVRVSERHLDAVTGLSGSMPAYLFLVVEALIDAGVHQGLSCEVSRELVVATFEGAGRLLADTGESPEDLRAQVTSPGGTTAAGLRVLESRAVRSAMLEAVAAATERSRQLGR